MNRAQTNVPNSNRVQFQKPPVMTESNVAETSQPDFPNNQTNPQDYYAYSGNSGHKADNESYYNAPNLSNSVLKLFTRLAKEKA